MYSYFHNGIKDINPEKVIDFQSLVKLIKDNPLKSQIESIRNLRRKGEEYKKFKAELPYITPNCNLKIRRLSQESGEIDKNLISMSQYVFFDIDINTDVNEYKQYIINKYGTQVSLVCISSGGGGLSLLFRVSNTITKENFEGIWWSIRNTILIEEDVDEKCSDIGRAMFISHDPAAYINYENEIKVDVVINDTIIEKRVSQYKSYNDDNNTLKYSFSLIPFDEVLKVLITETQVQVDNVLFDFKPIEYLKVFIPKILVDGTKHTKYTSIIHTLVYLNPNINKDVILSYLYHANNIHAKPRMEYKELIRLFNVVYNSIMKNGSPYVKTKTKYLHFNPTCGLSSVERMNIANVVNGLFKEYKSINKIYEAKQQLQLLGTKITQKNVSKLSGLCPKTVQTHFNAERIDMDQITRQYNYPNDIITSLEPTSTD